MGIGIINSFLWKLDPTLTKFWFIYLIRYYQIFSIFILFSFLVPSRNTPCHNFNTQFEETLAIWVNGAMDLIFPVLTANHIMMKHHISLVERENHQVMLATCKLRSVLNSTSDCNPIAWNPGNSKIAFWARQPTLFFSDLKKKKENWSENGERRGL